MSLSPSSERPLRKRSHGLLAVAATAVLAFILVGVAYNAIGFLRLPQSGLKIFEIVWVSFTACLVVVLLALAIAAGVESLGAWLTPKPPSEQWLREEVRHHRIAGLEVMLKGEEGRRGNPGAAQTN